MKRENCLILALLTIACLLTPTVAVVGAGKGDWELSDDGKRWQYLYGPDEPAENEWIEYDGKEYYVDSKGYMKTGWVTDAWDGSKYYTGTDGAKRYNMFTPDGSYVGPEGTRLELFDKYRKAVKKELTKLIKGKEYKQLDSSNLPGFLLVDLNGDRYQDIIVVNRAEHPERVIMVAVWEPEDESLLISAEADLFGEEVSRITINHETQSFWLKIADAAEQNIDYFRMDASGSFENLWHFTTKRNDWDDPVYYIDGIECRPDEWIQTIALAEAEAGQAIEGTYIILNDENMNTAVDRAPTQEELSLWE